MRRARAEIKAQLRSGSVALSELLGSQPGDHIRERIRQALPSVSGEEVDYALEGMRAFDLIRAVHNIGFVRANQLFETIGISAKRKVRGLGLRQRQQLIEQIEALSSGR
jgi:hypothetical protein